jgi:hypothetical protein
LPAFECALTWTSSSASPVTYTPLRVPRDAFVASGKYAIAWARERCYVHKRLSSYLAIPFAVVPPTWGAGQALPVKVERPTGRTTFAGRGWSARLVLGRRRRG